ncbi:hypothetical protein KJ567_00020, partial [Candidatus Bipolaricaulota bacterium]|nr:hypothetical protein [Candidatus Bipolaricaulota bacterium]
SFAMGQMIGPVASGAMADTFVVVFPFGSLMSLMGSALAVYLLRRPHDSVCSDAAAPSRGLE